MIQYRRQRQKYPGVAALPVVTTVGVIMLVSLWTFFQTTTQQQQIQADVELRTDFHQREQAFTRALLVVAPNKMMGCMMANSNSQASQYTWSEVFSEAIALAQAQQSTQTSKWANLGINNARSGNPAEGGTITVSPLVPVQISGGTPAQVNSGTTKFYGALSAAYPSSFPEPLNSSTSSVMDNDCIYPLITTTKQYTTNSTGLLQASVANYPLYNQMAYPQVRFPITTPGNPFVAKRNWWAFQVTYSSAPKNGRPAKSVTKNYVLSAYEVPSQLPISANVQTVLGQHADGSSWNAVNKVMGAVYADSLQTNGGFNWQGASSAQQPTALSRQGTSVGTYGQSAFSWMNPNFDQMGTLEQWQAANNQEVGQMGTSGDAGRTAFIPIASSSGTTFNQMTSYSSTPNSISPTLWDVYSNGANQCNMMVQVVGVANLITQSYTPTDLKISCTNAAGTGQVSIIMTRDQVKGSTPGYVYWPQGSADSTQPFQTEQLTDANGNPVCGLNFMPGNLSNWLSTVFAGQAAAISGSGAGAVINNRIYFEWISSISQTQSSIYQTGLVLSDPASDLTGFNYGLSVVSAVPVYVESDLNNTPDPQRAVQDPTHPYPPLSVYGYDIYVGTKTVVQELVVTNGQLASMNSTHQGSSAAFYPLDIKSFATNQALPDFEIQLGDPDNPSASGLIQIVQPSELPPITQMNWLLTLDEVHTP